MKNRLMFIIFPILFWFGAEYLKDNNLNLNNMNTPPENYDSLWNKVSAFEMKGLPKSALEVVEQIYSQSKADNNGDQLIKSSIYKMKMKQQFEDTMFQAHLNTLIKDADEVAMPQKSVLYILVAQLYKQYARSNYYSIIKRTDTENFDNPDLETWTINMINAEALKYIYKALQDPKALMKYTPDDLPSVAKKGSKPSFCRPTLYDYVAYEALDILREMRTPTPETFFYSGSEYFDYQKFAALDIKCDDSLSLNYNAAKILQQLANERINAGNDDALVDFELYRLGFVSGKSTQDNKLQLMKEALESLQKRFSKAKYKAAVDYTLAKFYYDQVEKVTEFGEGNSTYRKTAHDICSKIVADESADKEYKTAAFNLIQQLEKKEFSFVNDDVVIPGSNFAALVQYRNISKLYAKVLKIDRSKYEEINKDDYDRLKRLKGYLRAGKQVAEFSKDIPDKGDYLNRSTEIVFQKLSDYGFYLLLLSDSPDFAADNCIQVSPITVSNLVISSVPMATGFARQYYVTSRTTGEPLQNVTLTLYYEEYSRLRRKYVLEKASEVKTDGNGYALVKRYSDQYYRYSLKASTPEKDSLTLDYVNFNSYTNNPEGDNIQIFTDRAIYRPGQTVYYKAYAMRTDANRVTTPIVGLKCGVGLRDVNDKEIAFMNAVSNDYGTFSGSFVIPTGLLNGRMTIMINHQYSKEIRVEEYKRPTFEVNLNRIEGSYIVNDEITVTGNAKSFSGMKIDGAEVKFRVQRRPQFDFHRYFFFMPLNQNPVEIVHGTVTADENGDFKFTFKAEPDPMAGTAPDVAFNYITSVDITDHSGETRSASQSVTVGYSSLGLSVSIPNAYFRDSVFKTTVRANNLDGSPLNVKGKLTVTRLIDNGLLRNRKWAAPNTHSYTKDEWQKLMPGCVYDTENDFKNFAKGKVVATREFDTQQSKEYFFEELKNVESGVYLLEAVAKDPKTGREIKAQSYSTISRLNDGKLPTPQFLDATWLTSKTKVGDVAKIMLGTSVTNAVIQYKLYYANKELKSEYISLSNGIKVLEIPLTKELIGNLSIFFNMNYQNRHYSYSMSLTVPDPDIDLNIEYLSFRDKLQPGENETWKLKITDNYGKNVSAEMVATLYDKSLDAFASNYCNINFPSKYTYCNLYFDNPLFGTQGSDHISSHPVKREYYSCNYGNLYWFDYYYRTPRRGGDYGDMMMGGAPLMMAGRARAKSMARMDEDVVMEECADEAPMMEMAQADAMRSNAKMESSMANMMMATKATGAEPEPEPEVKVRENFNETAFFYPELRTDENGEISIEFTIPESLTTWKLLGIAHTKQMQYANTTKELITQKQLMVQPNPPRFFRENDRIILPVKVGNLTENALSGSVTIEFFDPFTNNKVDGVVKNANLSFTCKPGGNAALEYELNIPEKYSALGYKVIAKSGNFADGEQKVIPVMSNRMLVTESLPLPINGNQTKNYKFEKLISSGNSSTLRHHKLTLEFTSNPAWYAIQALPYMMEYPYECNEQTFSRLYANSIAAHIANSSPKIKAVFDAWKNTNSQELISNLEKNQELKSVLLQETPWVMQGANETERKKRVGLLFDLSRIAGEESRTLEKLRKNQYPSGGWPWFDGMPESDYVTMQIVSGIGHLKRLGIKTFDAPQNANMADKAVDYIDEMIAKYYKELKRWHKDEELKEGNFLTFTAIDYLYTRSFFKEKAIPGKTKEAFEFFKGKAEKFWLSTGKYSQAMICLALNRFGSTAVPKDILKSLKEKSTTNEEMGRYFVDNISGFLWQQAPIETQAIIIEAFDEVGNDQQTVDELKIWLLKNKQTNDWKTTKATAEACYALLLRGTDVLADSKICEIKLDGKAVDPNANPDIKSEAGTGYFKTSWSGDAVKPGMGNVSVTNPNRNVAWGALYWQYFEQLDKITFAETPLKLSKKLFREKVTDRGTVIEPVTEKTDLKPGDKIVVRIEIRTDRDMEYVHLKDMRASGFEPADVFSGYRYQDGLGYYQCTKDASTNFFIEFLRKGTYVFEYRLFVQHRGNFSNGITTIQCMYAPEFTAHSEGVRVEVK